MDIIIRNSNDERADSQHFCMRETEILTLLGPVSRSLAIAPQQAAGSRLLVSMAESVAPGAAVRIDHEDGFLLGEVTGCRKTERGGMLAVWS